MVKIPTFSGIVQGCKNLRFYFRRVWGHRFWDYGFQLEMMDKMMEDCENNWVVNTIYVGDTFTLKRIKVIRRQYQRYVDSCEFEQEELKKFLKMYSRNLPRLWD